MDADHNYDLDSNSRIMVETETAYEWWHSIRFEDQFYKVIEWLSSQGRNTTDRHPDNLSVDEVKEIYQLNHKS